MSGIWKKSMGWALCGLGGVSTLAGVWAIGAYVSGVVSVLGQPDQSWIFWGLVILFIGLAALALGLGLVALGRSLLK